MDEHFYDGIMDKCQEMEISIIKDKEYNDTATPPNYYVNTLHYYLSLIWRHFLWDIQFIDKCLSKVKYDICDIRNKKSLEKKIKGTFTYVVNLG